MRDRQLRPRRCMHAEAKLKALEERQDAAQRVANDAARTLQHEVNDNVSRIRKARRCATWYMDDGRQELRLAQTKMDDEVRRMREDMPRDLENIKLEILSEARAPTCSPRHTTQVEAKLALRRHGSSSSLDEVGRPRAGSTSEQQGRPRSGSFTSDTGTALAHRPGADDAVQGSRPCRRCIRRRRRPHNSRPCCSSRRR